SVGGTMRKLLVVPLLAAAVFAGLASQARASGGVAAGTLTFLSDDLQFRGVFGGDLVFSEVAVIAYDGGLTGVATDTDTLIVYPDGSYSSHGTETCAVCSLAGRHGSFTSTFVFAGNGPDYHGALRFTGGSGGL